MPIYEYQCTPCGHVSSIYFRTTTDTPDLRCRYCGSSAVQRILSAFASPTSDLDKMSKLDPKYDKMVDAALRKAPAASEPNHYLRQMASFSQAKE